MWMGEYRGGVQGVSRIVSRAPQTKQDDPHGVEPLQGQRGSFGSWKGRQVLVAVRGDVGARVFDGHPLSDAGGNHNDFATACSAPRVYSSDTLIADPNLSGFELDRTIEASTAMIDALQHLSAEMFEGCAEGSSIEPVGMRS